MLPETVEVFLGELTVDFAQGQFLGSRRFAVLQISVEALNLEFKTVVI